MPHVQAPKVGLSDRPDTTGHPSDTAVHHRTSPDTVTTSNTGHGRTYVHGQLGHSSGQFGHMSMDTLRTWARQSLDIPDTPDSQGSGAGLPYAWTHERRRSGAAPVCTLCLSRLCIARALGMSRRVSRPTEVGAYGTYGICYVDTVKHAFDTL